MTLEEQVKVIKKQIDFLTKFKDKFTAGKPDKIVEFNYTIESLESTIKILNGSKEFRDALVDCIESTRETINKFEDIIQRLIM